MEFIGLVVLCVYAGYTIRIYYANNAAATAAKNSADWLVLQTKDIFNDHRPFIWVKVPDTIRIEAGKPIRPDIQIFNYGKVPGMAGARIRFEAASGVIERFRDTLRNHPDKFSLPQQDQIGTPKLLIPPGTGRHFPIETSELVLSKQDIDKLVAGTIDVAMYGRIFYTDLNNAANGNRNDVYESIFCFYIMPNGSTSACSNRYTNREEYTNWVP